MIFSLHLSINANVNIVELVTFKSNTPDIHTVNLSHLLMPLSQRLPRPFTCFFICEMHSFCAKFELFRLSNGVSHSPQDPFSLFPSSHFLLFRRRFYTQSLFYSCARELPFTIQTFLPLFPRLSCPATWLLYHFESNSWIMAGRLFVYFNVFANAVGR